MISCCAVAHGEATAPKQPTLPPCVCMLNNAEQLECLGIGIIKLCNAKAAAAVSGRQLLEMCAGGAEEAQPCTLWLLLRAAFQVLHQATSSQLLLMCASVQIAPTALRPKLYSSLQLAPASPRLVIIIIKQDTHATTHRADM